MTLYPKSAEQGFTLFFSNSKTQDKMRYVARGSTICSYKTLRLVLLRTDKTQSRPHMTQNFSQMKRRQKPCEYGRAYGTFRPIPVFFSIIKYLPLTLFNRIRQVIYIPPQSASTAAVRAIATPNCKSWNLALE